MKFDSEHRILIAVFGFFAGALFVLGLMCHGVWSSPSPVSETPEAWLVTMLFSSLLLASVQLCAAWAALGPGHYLRRCMWSLGVLLCLLLSLSIGLTFSSSTYDPDFWTTPTRNRLFRLEPFGSWWKMFLEAWLVIFWFWIFAQLPFLVCRVFGNRYLEKLPKTIQAKSISISDLLMGTLVVAIALGAVELFKILFMQMDLTVGSAGLVGLLFLASVIYEVCFGLAVAVPAIMFVMNRNRTTRGFFAFTLHIMVLAFVLMLIAGRWIGPLKGMYVVLYFFGFVTWLSLPLLVMRLNGYRIFSDRRSESDENNPIVILPEHAGVN